VSRVLGDALPQATQSIESGKLVTGAPSAGAAGGSAGESGYRRSGPIRSPAAESSMSVARRRCRVASRLALITHQVAVFR
jgi:hypothetical protein